MVNKEIFQIITNLYKKHPWIGLNEKGLLSLLNDDCKTKVNQELIIRLLNDFFYLSETMYKEKIKEIAEIILSFCPNETLVYASAIGKETDSSQYIVYLLRTILPKIGGNKWQKASIYSHMSKPVLTKDNKDSVKNIFIIDEFNGSGQTIKSRYKKISDDLKLVDKQIYDYNIHFIYITSIDIAHQTVVEEGINLTSINIIKKGISFNDNIKDKESAKEIIKEISNVFSSTFLSEIMHPLGYNDSEALYYREDGNVPNSVFPIFWWPEYADKKSRNQLIVRAI